MASNLNRELEEIINEGQNKGTFPKGSKKKPSGPSNRRPRSRPNPKPQRPQRRHTPMNQDLTSVMNFMGVGPQSPGTSTLETRSPWRQDFRPGTDTPAGASAQDFMNREPARPGSVDPGKMMELLGMGPQNPGMRGFDPDPGIVPKGIAPPSRDFDPGMVPKGVTPPSPYDDPGIVPSQPSPQAANGGGFSPQVQSARDRVQRNLSALGLEPGFTPGRGPTGADFPDLGGRTPQEFGKARTAYHQNVTQNPRVDVTSPLMDYPAYQEPQQQRLEPDPRERYRRAEKFMLGEGMETENPTEEMQRRKAEMLGIDPSTFGKYAPGTTFAPVGTGTPGASGWQDRSGQGTLVVESDSGGPAFLGQPEHANKVLSEAAARGYADFTQDDVDRMLAGDAPLTESMKRVLVNNPSPEAAEQRQRSMARRMVQGGSVPEKYQDIDPARITGAGGAQTMSDKAVQEMMAAVRGHRQAERTAQAEQESEMEKKKRALGIAGIPPGSPRGRQMMGQAYRDVYGTGGGEQEASMLDAFRQQQEQRAAAGQKIDPMEYTEGAIEAVLNDPQLANNPARALKELQEKDNMTRAKLESYLEELESPSFGERWIAGFGAPGYGFVNPEGSPLDPETQRWMWEQLGLASPAARRKRERHAAFLRKLLAMMGDEGSSATGPDKASRSGPQRKSPAPQKQKSGKRNRRPGRPGGSAGASNRVSSGSSGSSSGIGSAVNAAAGNLGALAQGSADDISTLWRLIVGE